MSLRIPWFPLAVGGAALAAYTASTAPGIVELFDDTLEFQVAGPTFGIAHPTGYPLYIILSGLWSRVLFPIGEWAWRMNLFSALLGAAAVAVTAHLGARLAAIPSPWRELTGLAAALAFGLGPVWWSQVTEAEVYALHLLFVTLILALTLAVITPAGSRAGASTTARRIHLMTYLALAIGLGLAHHRTTVLLLPAVGLVLLWRAPELLRPSRHWFRWLGALLLPLLLYLWIPLRAAMGVQDLHGSYANTWAGFWDHVLARRYVAFFSDNPLMVTRTNQEWIALFVEQMSIPALLLALIGLALTPWRMPAQRAGWALVSLTLATNLVFAANYRVGDVEVFLLPAFLCLALLAAMGLSVLLALVLERQAERAPRLNQRRLWAGSLLLVLTLGGLALGLGGRAPVASRAAQWGAHDYAYLIASVDFPPDSRLIGLEGEITALRYMQAANRLGRNVQSIVANLPEQRQRAIEEAIATGAPVFITREVAGIEERYHFSGAGPLVRVWPSGQVNLSSLEQEIGYALEGAPLRLDAATLVQRTAPGGAYLEVALDWQLTEPTPRVYKLSLRLLHYPPDDSPGDPSEPQPLVDRQGAPIVADVFPLRQVALTSHWPTDQIVRDVHYLPLPPTIPADTYLQVIIYDAETIAEVGRWETALDAWQHWDETDSE